MNQRRYKKLSEKAKTVLQVICSNYRDNINIKANFSCRSDYGADRFYDEIYGYLNELKKQKFISDFSIGESDEREDSVGFGVTATVDMSVEDMAQIAINSQSIYVS